MARIEMTPGWEEEVLAAWDTFADARLGPAIRDDAKRYCPVDTGALRDSIEHVVAPDHHLLVLAYGSDERWYASDVELGHRVYHPSTGRVGPETVPPSPFLRPALYKVRGE